jgi:signal transduction histidine kinase
VRDDGQKRRTNTPPSGTGFGLLAMQERARQIGATFTWTSDPQTGTEVMVAMPVEAATMRRRERTK